VFVVGPDAFASRAVQGQIVDFSSAVETLLLSFWFERQTGLRIARTIDIVPKLTPSLPASTVRHILFLLKRTIPDAF
jgi:hypothetical protein